MVRRRSDFPPHCRRCRSNDHRFVQKTVPGQRDARSGRTPGPRRRRCLHNAGLVLVGRWVFSPGPGPFAAKRVGRCAIHVVLLERWRRGHAPGHREHGSHARGDVRRGRRDANFHVTCRPCVYGGRHDVLERNHVLAHAGVVSHGRGIHSPIRNPGSPIPVHFMERRRRGESRRRVHGVNIDRGEFLSGVLFGRQLFSFGREWKRMVRGRSHGHG